MSNSALRSAFLGASYGTATERFRLSPSVPARHARLSWMVAGRSWALVTAWNPGGVQTNAEVNARADGALRARVDALRLRARPAVNGERRWREAALLLEDLRLADAVALGREFGQVAVLYGIGHRTALVWCGEAAVHAERLWAVPHSLP